MAQCTATVTEEKSPNFGQQCKRLAMRGAEHCVMHGGRDEVPAGDRLPDRPLCHATKADGTPCKKFAMKGTTVCDTHGGRSPNTKAKAKERLMEMVDPALVQLRRIIDNPATSDADKLRAIAMVLNRTGYHEKSELTVEHELKPWEQLVEGVVRDVPGEVIDVEVIDSRPALPSDEQVEALMAEMRAMRPAPPPTPVPDNVAPLRSRANPPEHLR